MIHSSYVHSCSHAENHCLSDINDRNTGGVGMDKEKILILGIGHNTAVYVELAELLGYEIEGLYHYKKGMTGQVFYGYPVLGCNDELFSADDLSQWNFVLSMGDNAIRSSLGREIRKRHGKLPTMIHPTASVSKYAKLDEGVVVGSQATIQANAIIMQDSVISFNSSVTHDAIIEEAVYISGHSIVGAYTTVCRNSFIGMGSVVVSGKVKTVGENSIVGAGSVVIKDVEKNSTVVGNPAKPL
jgi:sugar O-acyltransferase (sialic acid O-acetyltransferase NeuD family)